MLSKLKTILAAAGVAVMAASAPAQAKDVVKIGWTTWDDAEVISKMTALILRKGMNQPVSLTLSDIDIQYRSVARGELDAMMMAWLKGTHANYVDMYGDDLVIHSTLYEGARLGLAVNQHCDPAVLSTLEDLETPEAKAALNSEVIGIDPGAGITRMTKDLLDGTGIKYKEGTSFSMARDVEKANENGTCVAFPMWNPHWMFGAMDIRYLEDTNGHYGDAESVHVVVRKGFEQDFPEVAAMMGRMRFEMDELEAILAEAKATNAERAALNWIKNNQDRVKHWMTGK